LGIIHPNKELEEKWEELSQLAARYKELEAEIKDKEKMWAILKR
jgi:flagellar motility protein MotE (MotC chaperone)